MSVRGSLLNRAGWIVRGRPSWPVPAQILIGLAAAAIAVAIRYLLPLQPNQLPTLTLVVALAFVTLFVGLWSGISTAVIGGLLSWYLFFNPESWSLAGSAWIPLLGFAVISVVIITTSQLYRASERRLHERHIAELETRAATSDLFAREMAHRLKNSLAIVQSIAFRTVGRDGEVAEKFAGRLKALADANDLLAEHVEKPTASAREVMDLVLRPFIGHRRRIAVEGDDGTISAQQAVSLALVIHELCTNATKYGALSVAKGSVQVRLEALDDRLRMTWTEHGGPALTAPASKGFGMRLIDRAGLGTKIDWRREGLVCDIDLRRM